MAEKQTLRSKRLEEQRFNYAFYTFVYSDSEPKSLRFGYPAGANVLEQEKYGRADRKMGLQAKERSAGGTVTPFGLLTSLRWLPPPWRHLSHEAAGNLQNPV